MPRPKINIDWKKVDKLLKSQCDGVGIAGILGIDPDTLYKHCEEDNKMCFSAYSQQKKSEGKELLRAKQFESAMQGEKSMLIWLGKQYLEQTDKQETKNINKNFDFTNLTNEEIESKLEELLQNDKVNNISFENGADKQSE